MAMLQEDCIVQNTSRCNIPNNLRSISYASKTLSSTESNYSNIECELLGVLFTITHFKHFTNRHTVHVITDHKPLVSLFKKSLVDASPCSDTNANAVIGLYIECMLPTWRQDAPQRCFKSSIQS